MITMSRGYQLTSFFFFFLGFGVGLVEGVSVVFRIRGANDLGISLANLGS